MIIARAKPEEYPEVRRFYHSLIDALENAEYRPMWQKDVYPSPEELAASIQQGCLYIGREAGKTAAAMVVNQSGNEAYNTVAWKTDAGFSEVMVIHMLGVHSDYARRGFGREMVCFALQLAKEAGMKAIRLDVLKGNIPANRLYEGLGFMYVDTVPMYYEDTGWTEFELYEYRIMK